MDAGAMPRRWSRRGIALLGVVYIVGVIGLAIYDVWRGYRQTRDDAWQALETQARVVAEQTTRSLQAMDGVLRHVAEAHAAATLRGMGPDALHAYLRDQAVGLAQAEGVAIIDAHGRVLATSIEAPAALPPIDASHDPRFMALRDAASPDPLFSGVLRRRVDGSWVLPLTRRLRMADGGFDGFVTVLGRVDYFQNFYRDAFPENGTRVALMMQDTTLVARYPPADQALGQKFSIATDLAMNAASGRGTGRMHSQLDGADLYAATWAVPDYPLLVVVARSAQTVLSTWHQQAFGSAVRTLALALPAALLLALVLRQLGRLDAARASLEVSQQRYALAAAGADDGIWDWDVEAGVGFESARSRELQGLAREPETQPLPELEALPTYEPADAQRRRDMLAAHLRGETAAFEGDFRVRRPDGVRRWVHVRGLCVRAIDGRALRIAGSVTDIDARKRAEERYELAVRGSNEGLWDEDIDRHLLFLSPRAQEVLLGARDTPMLSVEAWRQHTHVHADDRAMVERAIDEHLRGETPVFTAEYRVQPVAGPHAGTWRWVRRRGIALRDEQGRVYRMAGSLEDISDRKAGEAERERLEGQLRQAQKLEAIGTLAGGIAHDFNNILAAIVGFAELARRDAPEGSAQRAHLDASLASGTRAKLLVERILAFSRSGSGERGPVHVRSVVEETLDGLAATLPEGVRLERRLDAGDAAVIGDATQIHQVVMNLGANAVQAVTPPGTVAVWLRRVDTDAPRALTTGSVPSGRWLQLEVRDSGCGVAPSVMERIFDPFFTTKDVGLGTGLGLSLVHGIVAELGGGIDVSSRPGHGSVFAVWLPYAGEVEPPAEERVAVPLGSGQLVLLVDDEPALVDLGEEALAGIGYEPVVFTSSAEALAELRAAPDRFDLVLSDEAMPGMTGSQFVAAVRALRPNLPIVMMSGFVTPELLARARQAGVSAVLAKPLAPGELARALAAAFESRGAAG